jgi:hypothetical protein
MPVKMMKDFSSPRCVKFSDTVQNTIEEWNLVEKGIGTGTKAGKGKKSRERGEARQRRPEGRSACPWKGHYVEFDTMPYRIANFTASLGKPRRQWRLATRAYRSHCVDIPVFLLSLFAKNEKTDLTPKERSVLKKVLPQVVKDYKARSKTP